MANQGCMFHSGQTCAAGSRTYVQEDIYEEFVAKAVEIAKGQTVGDPLDMSSQHGPQVWHL